MKLRSSYNFIFIGLILIALAITLQIKLGSTQTQLKPQDPITAKELYNPQENSITGNLHGNVTIVEFFDYNCKYCRQLHPKIKELITANPDLRVVYKEFLLFGAPSLIATSAALAAQKQGKYAELQEALFRATKPLTLEEVLKIAKEAGLNIKKLKKDMDKPEIQIQIQTNTALAAKLDIDGAPAFIVADSRMAETPEKINTPQYLFKSSNNAEIVLQELIDKVKRDKK